MVVGDENKVIIALDVSSRQQAENLISQLTPPIGFYKIGLELYTAEGNNFIQSLRGQNLKVFLDLKLHDTPNTVAKTVANISKYKPDMITVHALGGSKMLEAAVQTTKQIYSRMKVLAVTVLTSLDQALLKQIGLNEDIEGLIGKLGQAGYDSGCDGLICSASDLPYLREKFGPPFLLVTPGIRLPEDEKDDQLRTASAKEALENGADYLVVGRSITHKKQPADALKKIF